MSHQDDEYVPLSFVNLLIDRWWVLIAGALLGAAVGLVLSFLLTPMYQSEAVFAVNIDYGVTEPLEIVVEDRVLNRIAATITSDETFSAVLQELDAGTRSALDLQDLSDLEAYIHLDRRLAEWHLIVRASDPIAASALARAWGDTTLRILDEAMVHAWKAQALMNDPPFTLECEQMEGYEKLEEALRWNCRADPLSLDPGSLEGALQQEIQLSRGLLPDISYEYIREPLIPDKPITYSRGILIFTSASIGLIIAVGVLFVRSFRKLDDK